MLYLGSDPELFLFKNGKPKSVIGLLGGTKEAPVPVKELGKGFAYQEDNVLAEYNIPATTSMDSWRSYHTSMMKYLADKLKEHGTLRNVPSAIMPDSELENPRAHLFGCEPDFNVWDIEVNPKPHAENPALRSGGGHIHFGFKMSKVDKVLFGRYCDLGLGLHSVLEDSDTQRRNLYGGAGCIRFKPYGIEYRTLSNYWVESKWLGEIYNRAFRTYKAFHGKIWTPYIERRGPEIRKAIDTSDKTLASELIAESLS